MTVPCPPDASVAALEKLLTSKIDAQKASTDAEMRAMTARFDAQIVAQERMATLALEAANAAVAKAEAASEKRFESVNEFRAVLTDQQKTLMTRTETVAAIATEGTRISALAERVAGHDAAIIRLESLKTSVDIHTEAVKRLDAAVIRMEERKAGGAETWAKIALAVGLVGGVLAILVRFGGP